MSILLNYKRGDTVYMATTTFFNIRGRAYSELCEFDYPIKKLDNGILISVPDNLRLRQAVFAYPEIFDLDKNGNLTKKHLVLNIVPTLKNMLKAHELIEKDDDSPYMMDDCIVVSYKDVIFEIGEEFNVLTYDTYQALGVKHHRYGSYVLANIKESDDVNEKLVQAMDNIVSYTQIKNTVPYILINTKDLEFQIVGGNAK